MVDETTAAITATPIDDDLFTIAISVFDMVAISAKMVEISDAVADAGAEGRHAVRWMDKLVSDIISSYIANRTCWTSKFRSGDGMGWDGGNRSRHQHKQEHPTRTRDVSENIKI